MPRHNLFSPLPPAGPEEHFEPLLSRPGLRIERIVSQRHGSPPGFWYEQTDDEWVMLAQGSAELEFDDGELQALAPGDWLLIPIERNTSAARSAREAADELLVTASQLDKLIAGFELYRK